MLRKSLLAIAAILILLVASVPALRAQTATGTILGHISDASGAVVAGAEVNALNPEKGTTVRSVSDDQGIYRFFYLEPASYTLTFRMSGFATLDRPGIALRSNDTLTVDVQMSVGNVVEKVEVTGAAPLLETATSATGTVVAGTYMNSLPIMQRYTWMAMYYMPGVSPMNGFHIAGARDRALGYSMDGISGTEPVRGGVATNRILSTTQNAIQEVKLVTTVLPAENGHTAGGMLSATYVSGTNQFHFEAEDRYIDNPMLHRAYFNLARSTQPFSYHELAGLVSGPVYIPKLYNGKNKTFFMFGISRHDERYFQQQFNTVPTTDMLNGDFSFGGIGYPIYDPASTALGANNQWANNVFPNNVVPKSRFDPATVNFLGHNPWLPPNNLGGSALITKTGPQLNFGGSGVYYSFRTRFDTKIDHNISDKNRIFGRYSHVRNRAQGNQVGINWPILDGGFVLLPSNQQNAVISDTHIFSPSRINELRLGFNRRKETRNPPGLNENGAQQLGIPGVSGATFPSFLDSGGSAFFSGSTFAGGQYVQQTQNYTLQDNFTIIHSRHSFKMGYEALKTAANSLIASQPGGIFRFGGTGFPFTPNTGNDFAAFLLGSVVRADFSSTLANWLPRWWSHALYFQDDWSVTNALTLNLGLRWSYESPFQTKYGQQSEFSPTAIDPLTGLKGAITHPTGQLNARQWHNFQPRLGMAYKINNNTVFRGGFGITSIDLFTTDVNQFFEEYTSSVSVQRPSGDPRPAFFLSQGPGPLNYNILPNGSSPFVGVNYSARSATWRDPNIRSPYAMNWNGTLQYQFRPTWLAELSYQGSAGVGLLNAWNINQVPFNTSTDPTTLNAIYSNYQAYRPYPNFGSINLWSNFGHSTYHSGTVKLEKRYSKGLTLTSFYTFSKAIDESDADGNANGADYYNRSLEKGRAGFDVSHRFVTFLTLEAPFGKGRRWMNGGGTKDWVLGGWNLAWTQTFQTGTPVSFTLSGSPNRYLGSQGGTVIRPNQIASNDQVIVPNWHIGDRFDRNLENPMWNVNSFANPAAFALGTIGRNTINGPGLRWSQASLQKNFHIKERHNVEIRLDVDNVFKDPNFSNPSSTVNLASPALFGKPTGTQGGYCCLGGQFTYTIGGKYRF